MKHKLLPLIVLFFTVLWSSTQAQNVQVDVNLNIKHEVGGVSDFGRERHITVHSSPTEKDWKGEEDKLDYFVNDLDVYFGRDNGSATWKFQATTQDPNRPSHPDLESLKKLGGWLKGGYSKALTAHQYKNKGAMIMGTNPHPLYPTLSWYPNGSTWDNWQPKDVETAAEWVINYLDYCFQKYEGENGEPMPKYWEVVNEIDMEFMTGKLLFSSYENIWKYHNLVREGLRERLGDKAPKVGGMTWGQHDFASGDGLGRMTIEKALSWGLDPKALATKFEPHYKDAWFQWDVLFQGFMDACPTMDFWSIHLYDWPSEIGVTGGVGRTGGVVEATLDMIEWYDINKTGKRKEMIISEFGSVSGKLDDVSPKRRAWENLRPFNGMFMQFLERPSHITLTMPFAPVKAEWGDSYDAAGKLIRRYPSTLMDKDENDEWQWTDFLLWYKQWSDVKGTRVETKSTDLDVQVDAYVDGNHVYLIMNSLQHEAATLDLNLFGGKQNKVKSVRMKNLYLDETLGTDGESVYDVRKFNTAPGSIVLEANGTIVLDYEFAAPVTIDEIVTEEKYMCDALGTGTTVAGGSIFRKEVGGRQAVVANVNNITIPTGACEATLRIAGKFWESGKDAQSITVNGHELTFENDWRGESLDRRNYWFCVFEVNVPKEFLKENNTITCTVNNNAVYTTVMLQVYDFSTEPQRAEKGNDVPLTAISLPATLGLMKGESEALVANFTPENATKKALTWTSDNTAVATVDEKGIVTVISDAGKANITATSVKGLTASVEVTATPFAATPVTGIAFADGETIDIQHYVTTPLAVTIAPLDATTQTVTWASADEAVATVDPVTGKVVGQVIGGSTTITASLTDTADGDKVYSATITVNIGVAGEEAVYCSLIPEQVTGNTSYTFDLGVNVASGRTVVLELKNGTTVLGTGNKSISVVGISVQSVNLELTTLPTIGTYTVVATIKEGDTVITSSETTIKIIQPLAPESIVIQEGIRDVQVGKTLSLMTVVLPQDAYDKTINWTSSNTAIATVSESGVITGVSAGSVEITGSTNDGNLTDKVTVTVQSGEVKIEPTSLELRKALVIFPSAQETLTVKFLPEWTTERLVDWTSSDPAIATVDENGVVSSGANDGVVTITATAKNSTSVLATCNVTVGTTLIVQAEDYTKMGGTVGNVETTTDDASGVTQIQNVQAGDFLEYSLYVPVAGEYEVSFITATAVDDGVIEFYVDTESKGSVKVPKSDWGKYAAYKLTATVTLTEGTHKLGLVAAGTSAWQWNMDRFELAFTKALEQVAATGVTIPSGNKEISIGQNISLSATVAPQNATNKKVTWSTTNENVATVINGKVTGVAEGTATIKVMTTDGSFTASVTITVKKQDPIAPASVAIDQVGLNLFVGATGQLSATVLPVEAVDKSVSWSSGDTSIATVDQDGVITIVAEGSVVISATTTVGGLIGTTTVTGKKDDTMLAVGDQPAAHAAIVYPNPAVNVLNISGVPAGEYMLTIVNLSGAKELAKRVQIKGLERVVIDQLPIGLYILNVSNANENISFFFQKQ